MFRERVRGQRPGVDRPDMEDDEGQAPRPEAQDRRAEPARGDRPARTLQLAKETTFWHEADRLVLLGSGAYLFSKIAAEQTSYPANHFVFAEHEPVEGVFERIVDVCGSSALVVGMGNIGGIGLPLARFFRKPVRLSRRQAA